MCWYPTSPPTGLKISSSCALLPDTTRHPQEVLCPWLDRSKPSSDSSTTLLWVKGIFGVPLCPSRTMHHTTQQNCTRMTQGMWQRAQGINQIPGGLSICRTKRVLNLPLHVGISNLTSPQTKFNSSQALHFTLTAVVDNINKK